MSEPGTITLNGQPYRFRELGKLEVIEVAERWVLDQEIALLQTHAQRVDKADRITFLIEGHKTLPRAAQLRERALFYLKDMDIPDALMVRYLTAASMDKPPLAERPAMDLLLSLRGKEHAEDVLAPILIVFGSFVAEKKNVTWEEVLVMTRLTGEPYSVIRLWPERMYDAIQEAILGLTRPAPIGTANSAFLAACDRLGPGTHDLQDVVKEMTHG